jgi:hypothetical protein
MIIKFMQTHSSLLLHAHAVSSLADFSTLKMEAGLSSETSVHFTGSTWRHIPEDGILHTAVLFIILSDNKSTSVYILSPVRL